MQCAAATLFGCCWMLSRTGSRKVLGSFVLTLDRAAVMLRGSRWVTLGGTSLYHILAGTGHLEVGGNVCTYTGSAAHAWVVGASEFDQSGCGKVLWGAASTIRASPAGQGKLKQRNAFPSSLCCKDPLKLMGVSIQNFILFSRGSCVCITTIFKRWIFQDLAVSISRAPINSLWSSEMALSHEHDLVNYWLLVLSTLYSNYFLLHTMYIFWLVILLSVPLALHRSFDIFN